MKLIKPELKFASAAILALAGASAADAQLASAVPGATRVSEASGGAERNDLSFSIVSRYDSNVPRIEDETLLALRGFEQEDIRVSPSANLFVSRNVGPHQVGLKSYLGYDFYVRNTRLNRERISVEPYVYLNLPVCDLTVEGQAARAQSELGDIIFVATDPGIGIDNTETRKRITGRVVCGETYGLRPTFEVEYLTGINSNPLRQIANYKVTRLQPGLSYASPSLGELSVYAVKRDTDLPNQLLPSGQPAGFSLKGLGLSYRRNIGTRLNFSGSVSGVEVTPYGGNTGSRSGINGSLALTFLASDRLQMTAFANRAFTSTLTSFSTYELSQGYGLGANYAANDRLRFRVGGQVAPREFFYAVTPTGPFIGKQTQYDIYGGVAYTLNRRMRLDLDTGVTRRDADLNQFDYRSFFASVGLTFSL